MDHVWFVERKIGEDWCPVGFAEATRSGARKQRDAHKRQVRDTPFRVRMYQRVEEHK